MRGTRRHFEATQEKLDISRKLERNSKHFETTQEELEKELGLWVFRGPAAKDYSGKKGAISTINRSIYQNRQLRIAYKKPLEDKSRWRLIEPYAILVYENKV